MKTLFITICISTILASLPLTYYFFSDSKTEEKNKLKRYILGYLFPIISSIFIICVTIYFVTLNIWSALLYLLIIILLVSLISSLATKQYFVGFIFIVFIYFSCYLLSTLNIEVQEKELQEKVITLYDYSEETKTKNKVIILELSEENGEAKSFVIKTHNSGYEDLLFYHDNDSLEYEIITSDNSRLEIYTTETTVIEFFDFFEISKPTSEKTETYKLFIKQEDILYN